MFRNFRFTYASLDPDFHRDDGYGCGVVEAHSEINLAIQLLVIIHQDLCDLGA